MSKFYYARVHSSITMKAKDQAGTFIANQLRDIKLFVEKLNKGQLSPDDKFVIPSDVDSEGNPLFSIEHIELDS